MALQEEPKYPFRGLVDCYLFKLQHKMSFPGVRSWVAEHRIDGPHLSPRNEPTGPSVSPCKDSAASPVVVQSTDVPNKDTMILEEPGERNSRLVLPEKELPPLSEDGNMVCPICNRKYRTKHQLNRHKRTHERPLRCNIPGCVSTTGFSFRRDLERHQMTSHPETCGNLIYYQCPNCRQKYITQNNLERHLKTVHNDWDFDDSPKAYECRGDGLPENDLVPKCPAPPEGLPSHDNGGESLEDPREFQTIELRNSEGLSPLSSLVPYSVPSWDALENQGPTRHVCLWADEHVDVAQSAGEIREQQTDARFQEGTVADSGYVSAYVSGSISDPKFHGELRGDETTEPPETQSRLAMDQQTMYTSSVMPRGSDYIIDLSKDIYRELKNDLQEHAYDGGRADLVKAFATRIGLDKSEPLRACVMHFLYTNCSDIVAELDALCKHREESPGVDHRKTDDDGMTVMDRIGLWIRKQNEEIGLEPKHDGLFEGVGDIEEEDIVSNAYMAKYRNVVLSNTSYKWFIESLRKQLSLDWPGGSDDLTEANSHRPIYQSIKSRIPPDKISKRKPPEIHLARFGIQMHPDVFHYLEAGSIADIMTLTSSAPNVVQALPVRDYLGQTWGSEGLRLAGIIQKAFDGEYGAVHTGDFDNGTCITAQVGTLEYSNLPKLLVTVSGSRFSIAEHGEQLAWLCAAFQRPVGKQSIANCTCNIESQQENEWSIKYALDNSLEEVSPINIGTAEKLRVATIIRGFPTKKRPLRSGFPGVELRLDCMLKCIGAYWSPVFENGRVVLKGYHHILELVKHAEDVLLWHIVHAGSTCSLSECPYRNKQDPSHRSTCRSARELESKLPAYACAKRHVIANLELLGLPVVNSESTTETKMSQPYARTQLQSAEMREDLDPELSQVDDKSSPMDSPGDSLESDMLSISSGDSDCFEILDPEGTLASTINQISHRILAEYKESRGLRSVPQWATTGNRERGGNSVSSSNQTSSCEASQSNAVGAKRNGKRSSPNDEEEDGDWDDGGFRRPPRPAKRPTPSSNRSRDRRLACPFWKLDCQANRLCFPRKLSRITDVKQHLRRTHRQPASEYCPRCWVAFENAAHREAHLSDDTSQICKYNPSARPVGIDNTMAVALHKKSNPKQSIEDQWFTIWEIVFPGQTRPSSPYIDDNLVEETVLLQEHIVNRWPSILATELEGAWEGLPRSNDTESLGLEHLIRETLSRLSDDFSAEQAQIRAARAVVGHQNPGSGGQTPSSSDHADSAIELEAGRSNLCSSAGSSNEISRPFPEPAMPQLETPSSARSQSGATQIGRERYILPRGQDSLNANNHPHQTPMPPQTTSPEVMFPGLFSTQTTYSYGFGHSVETELSYMFQQPTDDIVSQGFVGSGGIDGNVFSESIEGIKEIDWSMLEAELLNEENRG